MLLQIRRLQIKLLAKLLSWVGYRPQGRAWLIRARSHSFLRSVLELLLGYRRAFDSLAEAQARSSRYSNQGHEHPDEIRPHIVRTRLIRESDYPVLFFLAEHSQRLSRVFDLGGSVGNLFYAYQHHLKFAGDLIWMIHDLPEQKRLGTKIAIQRNEKRIRYVDSLADANGVDLFIVSGSLHYFESSLSQMLSQLNDLPGRVVVNRTPCSSGEDIVTVQDGISYVIPCKLHSRTKLLEGMTALGYVLRGEWPVYELMMWLPLYPECSNSYYSGFYFERRDISTSLSLKNPGDPLAAIGGCEL